MKAAVLSIGTELTRGELINSNAAWLAEQLTSFGFEVAEHATVDDDGDRIVAAVKRLAGGCRVVVATGGLGPTSDDMTSVAVGAAVGVPLTRDEPTVERIRAKWSAMGAEMPASNEKQADFPEGASILDNPLGTAPGFSVALGDCRLFFMPGVPKEMRHMFHRHVVPAVAPDVVRTSHQIHLRTFGLTESQAGDLLKDMDDPERGIVIGYRASFPEIEVKVLARADTEVEAEGRAREVADEVRRRLGDAVYGERDDTFASAVGRALRERELTLAVAESCTGGLVGTLLTSVPGSSNYVLMDAVVYANSAKTKMLGVSPDLLRAHGAVSEESAAAMAEGALRLSGADMAVSVTGVAGPGGGSDDKPVGTVWFGLAQKGRPTVTKLRKLPGDRDRIRTLAAYVALRMVLRGAERANGR
jgi:nicotinamide-nucleotide amidase